MSTKEAQRAASDAYRKRQKEAGFKQLGFMLSPEALAALDRLAINGKSKAKAVNEALIIAVEWKERRALLGQIVEGAMPVGPDFHDRPSPPSQGLKGDGATHKKPSKPKLDLSGVSVHPDLAKKGGRK
jgi:hypothetical protein